MGLDVGLGDGPSAPFPLRPRNCGRLRLLFLTLWRPSSSRAQRSPANSERGGGGGSRAQRSAPAAQRNTTQGRMLATALRLQVLKPHATLSCIGEALGGWSLSPHNLTSLLLVLKRRLHPLL